MKINAQSSEKAVDFSTLVKRARAGEQDAFTALYEATDKGIFRTIRSMVQTEEEALDIQQDTYVQAFTHLDQLTEPEKFGSWLHRIAVNYTKNALRRQSPVLFTELEDEEGNGLPELADLSPESSPELSLERKESAAYVREILDALCPGQRMLVGMYYYQQLPMRQIAEELGISLGAVKSQLSRSRKKIEAAVKRLEEKGVRLYGLSPLPFFLALMKGQNPAPEAGRAVLTKTLAKAGLTAGAKAGATAAGSGAFGTAAEAVVLHATRPFFTTAVGKIVLGVICAGVVAGGAAGFRWLSDRMSQTRDTTLPTDSEQLLVIPTAPTAPSTLRETVPASALPVTQDDSSEDLFTEPEATEPPAQGGYSGTCGENLTWKFDPKERELTIQGSGPMYDYADAQDAPWHSLRGEIRQIWLSGELTAIGVNAFTGCTALSYGNLWQVQRIGAHAFDGCVNFSSYPWALGCSNILCEIGDYAFRGCGTIDSVDDSVIVFPENLTRLGEGAFSDCVGLEEIRILNRDCVIGAAMSAPSVKLCGLPDSTAERYARQYGHSFNPIVDNRDAIIRQIKQDAETQGNDIYREETYLVRVCQSGDRYLGEVSHSTHVSVSEEEIQRAKQTGTIVLNGTEYRYADSDEKAVELAEELQDDGSYIISSIERGWDWAGIDYDEAAGWAYNAESSLFKVLRKDDRYYFLVCEEVGVYDPFLREYTDLGWLWLDESTPVTGTLFSMNDLPSHLHDCVLFLGENDDIQIDMWATG